MDIQIYANGPVHCSVCVPNGYTNEEIEQQVNRQNPTGIDSQWKIKNEAFATGEANPHKCEHDGSRTLTY